MTQWQQFLIFWQQAGHVEICIVPINTTNQVKYNFTSFRADD